MDEATTLFAEAKADLRETLRPISNELLLKEFVKTIGTIRWRYIELLLAIPGPAVDEKGRMFQCCFEEILARMEAGHNSEESAEFTTP